MVFSHTLSFDKGIYDVQVLQKAAYRSMNALTVDITSDNDQLICTLLSNIDVDESTFQYAIQEFRKDVLDYQLRHQLNAETQPVKNLILGLAFSRTGLVSE